MGNNNISLNDIKNKKLTKNDIKGILRSFDRKEKKNEYKQNINEVKGKRSLTTISKYLFKDYKERYGINTASKKKKEFLRAGIDYLKPSQEEELKEEQIEKNINILRSEEKAKYIKEKGGLEEGIGAKSRLERLERAKRGILIEDFTKTTSAAGHDNKKDMGAPHLVGAPAQPSAGILGSKNKSPFASAKSSRTPGGFIGSPENKQASGRLKNLPSTLPENKPPVIIPFSK